MQCLLFFHFNNSFSNAPQYYVIRILPDLFNLPTKYIVFTYAQISILYPYDLNTFFMQHIKKFYNKSLDLILFVLWVI